MGSTTVPSKSVTVSPRCRWISTTWSWPSSRASRVCAMKAATSEPRKYSPSPTPTTRGLLRREGTRGSGSSAGGGASGEAAPSRRPALRLALGAQRGEVLDDPVVDDRDPAVRGQVRVRVAVGRPAVGRPARVPDADRRLGQGLVGEDLLQVGQLAGLLRRRLPTVSEDGDARRVVPPVLQPAQTLQDDVQGVLQADVSHDAAHSHEVTGGA